MAQKKKKRQSFPRKTQKKSAVKSRKASASRKSKQTRKASSPEKTSRSAKPARTSDYKKPKGMFTVIPNMTKATVTLLTRALIPLLLILAVFWAFRYFDYYFIIQDIGLALDSDISRASIDMVLLIGFIILSCLSFAIMLSHLIPLSSTKIEYDEYEMRIGREIVPYKHILRVNFKNDLLYHKILGTAGLYILFTGRQYLPLYLEFVDDAKVHAERILNFAEEDKKKRYENEKSGTHKTD